MLFKDFVHVKLSYLEVHLGSVNDKTSPITNVQESQSTYIDQRFLVLSDNLHYDPCDLKLVLLPIQEEHPLPQKKKKIIRQFDFVWIH